jgi:BirA family transcriptional regulator, biotin operon repressor / biotin---[acetyl-CoA-carboxylase] ligase
VSEAFRYDGYTQDELTSLLGVDRLDLHECVGSTQDVAHELARADAAAGTLVLADQQTHGRGRSGNTWSSPPGWGIWLTFIDRPVDANTLDVLPLRLGMYIARVLDVFAEEPVRLKWPNDLYVDGRKVGGILVEARWRDTSVEWLAIGLGINVVPPQDIAGAAGLDPGTKRVDVLREILPAMKAAASQSGPLTEDELAEFATRDLARGRPCLQPGRGTVRGITPEGELLVALSDTVIRFRSGSLVLEDY